jgi:hypothetical protein
VTFKKPAHKASVSSLRPFVLLTSLLALASAALPLAAQVKVEGQILNGTKNGPVANQLVQLLAGGNGMREVATAKTDASGRYALTPSAGATGMFYLVQTVYEGVNYRSRVGDRGATLVTVYETTKTPPDLRIRSARIVVEAEGAKARVQEFFAIENMSQPPRTYANSDGTFRFRLGKGPVEPTAAVMGQMNMPIPQAVQDGKSPGEFLINHALQPGLTVLMVNYDTDYASQTLSVRSQVDYPIAHAELHVSPNNLSVDSGVFKPAGSDSGSGVQKFEAADIAGGTLLEAKVSGEAVPGSQPEQTGGEGEIKTLPNSMTRVGVLLMICFLLVLLWALGVRAAKEWNKPQPGKPASPAQKELEAKLDGLLNSLADLDQLHENGKVADKAYWKERLELKAKVVAILKQGPPTLLESYASRHASR